MDTIDNTRYFELTSVPFSSDKEETERAELLVEVQPPEVQSNKESPQHSSSPSASPPDGEPSRSLPVEDVTYSSPSVNTTNESKPVADHSGSSESGKDPEVAPTNQESDQVTVSNEADETQSEALVSGHSPKSKVTWMSLGRRRFNYDIIPKVFLQCKVRTSFSHPVVTDIQ